MTENPCKDVLIDVIDFNTYFTDMANEFDVSFGFMPGVRTINIEFNDGQKLSFDLTNCDYYDLWRRVKFWSNHCKTRAFADSISASHEHIEKFVTEMKENRHDARKLALNQAYGKIGV